MSIRRNTSVFYLFTAFALLVIPTVLFAAGEPIKLYTNHETAATGGVSWDSVADDVVGYVKFRYDDGQVSVYIDQVDSLAFIWNDIGCPIIPLSQDVLLVGTDPNEP